MNLKITGEQFKNAREQLGISQYVLSQKLGIGRTYLSLFESGRNALLDSELVKLQDFLKNRGVEINDEAVAFAGAEESAEQIGVNTEKNEFRLIENKIRELSIQPIPKGFFGIGISEEVADKKVFELLCLMAHQYRLNIDFNADESGELINTIGDRVNNKILEVLGNSAFVDSKINRTSSGWFE